MIGLTVALVLGLSALDMRAVMIPSCGQGIGEDYFPQHEGGQRTVDHAAADESRS
jgi:hypothetical protein